MSLERVGDIAVVRLSGDEYEMGRQLGALLAEEITTGALVSFPQYIERTLLRSASGRLGALLWSGAHRWLSAHIHRRLPAPALGWLRGVSEGSGLPYAKATLGATLPDALSWAVARLLHLSQPQKVGAHRLGFGLGCSSAVAWGDATSDGSLIHARNFDYPLVDVWPRTKCVLFCTPRSGQRYVSVTAAGAIGCTTAMNEAGLTLAVHQHMWTRTARLGLLPVGVAGERIMREARNLDDALRILEERPPMNAWTHVVTDGRSGEVLCAEQNPERLAAQRIRSASGTFGYSNVYLDPQLGETEVCFYPAYWRNAVARHASVRDQLRKHEGGLDVRRMASILAHVDPSCSVSRSLTKVTTVASVIFEPAARRLWVASGEAPTSHGSFVPFSFDTEDHMAELDCVQATAEDAPAERQAFERFRRAYLAYLTSGDPDGAAQEMFAAAELAPEQSLYHALAGLFALASTDAGAAEAAFARALSVGHPEPERMAGFQLWQARAVDLAGRRADALDHYQAVLTLAADPGVQRAARRGLERPFSRAQARRLFIDASLADVVFP